MRAAPPFLLVRYLVVDVVLDVVRFPLWWCTSGVANLWRWYGRHLHDAVESLALGVRFRYLGTPMFGDYTKQGRVISFFVRLFQLAFLIILFLLMWLWYTALFVAAFLLLPAAIWVVSYYFPHG